MMIMKKVSLLLSIALLAFSCEEKVASGEESNSVRMLIQETQCANPWQMAQDQGEYVNNIKAYLLAKGVNAKSVQVLDELPPDTALCMACTCWSGNNIYIAISSTEVEDAEALGFSRVD